MGPAEGYPLRPSRLTGICCTTALAQVGQQGQLEMTTKGEAPKAAALYQSIWLWLQLWLRPHLGPNRSPRKLNRRVGYG